MRPDVVATGVTLISVVAALLATRGREPNAVRSAVRRLLVGILMLLCARLWAWSGDTWAMVPLMLASAVLPLLVVLMCEQMCRRHAQHWLKLFAAVGGAAFVVALPILGAAWPIPALGALAAFQSFVGACCAVMLLRESDLSVAVDEAVRMMGLAVIIALPLVMTDFAFPLLLPVRMGSVGISLIMVALVLVARGEARPSALLRDIGWCSLASVLLAALATVTVRPLGDLTAFVVATLSAAAGLLVLRMSLTRVVSVGVARAVSRASGGSVDDVLASHPVLACGRILSGPDLELYDDSSLGVLARRGMVTRQTDLGADGDVAREILDAADASHLLHLGRGRFLAVAAGGFAGGTMDDELTLVARFAEARS